MEHTLRERIFRFSYFCGFVLILVVMEHTLRESSENPIDKDENRLNPCCNGTYSPSLVPNIFYMEVSVLILVVMEHTLREK